MMDIQQPTTKIDFDFRTAFFNLINKIAIPLDRIIMLPQYKKIHRKEIISPIFILGAERSGTTLLYSLLANNSQLYWLSRLDSVIPDNPTIASLIREIFNNSSKNYIAIPNKISKTRGFLPPSECLSYWRNIFKWGSEDAYLIEDDCFNERDVNEKIVQSLKKDLKTRLYWTRKNRLLFKQNGFSLKLRFINAVFPDAVFIHIIRDPYKNWQSLVRAKHASQDKFWGVKIPGWRNLRSRDIEYQAAIQLQATLDIIKRDCNHNSITKRFIQIKYEDLIANPRDTLERVHQFCNLEWDSRIENSFSGIRAGSKKTNNVEIDNEEILTILSIMHAEHGYDSPF